LFINGKRVPEPFCLVDMNVKSETQVIVQLEEGALTGEALRQKMLAEMGTDDVNEGTPDVPFDADSSDY
jgi:hypothetical protein